jgi:hypothetical protein
MMLNRIRAWKPGVDESKSSDKARWRWRVVVDPDGAFRGGLFTWEQVRSGGWDDGTTFQNVETGERRVWRISESKDGVIAGKLVSL